MRVALRMIVFVVCSTAIGVLAADPRPSGVIPWRQRLERPMLFFSAPNYYWAEAENVDRTLDAIQAAGLDGPSIELGGPFIVDEYNGKKTDRKVMELYARQLKAWAPWEAGIRARGLVAHIAFLNSNQSAANQADDAQWKALAAEFIRRHGSGHKIILPLSETDSRTRSSIGKAIAAGLTSAGFPGERLINFGDMKEEHSKGIHQVPRRKGGPKFLHVSDHGKAIGQMYGPGWRLGGVPNVAQIKDYVSRIKATGNSGVVYSFSRVFDEVGVRAAGAAWRSGAPPER